MKKSSRRSFGKQLTGALASLPVISTSVQALSQQRDEKKLQKPTMVDSISKEHDTPPPVILMDGSFIVEIAEDDFDEKDVLVGGRRKYRRHPKEKTKVHLAHVKVLDGSGEILFRFDNDMDHPRDIQVAIATQDGIVNVASVNNNFELDIPNGKKFDKTTGDDKPQGSKRKSRHRYKNSQGGAQHRIVGIKVLKAASVLFELNDFNDLPSKGEEIRTMIWLEET